MIFGKSYKDALIIDYNRTYFASNPEKSDSSLQLAYYCWMESQEFSTMRV